MDFLIITSLQRKRLEDFGSRYIFMLQVMALDRSRHVPQTYQLK